MYSVRSRYQQLNTTTEFEAKYITAVPKILEEWKNYISYKNGSLDRFSADLATNKQYVSWFVQYNFQTGLRPCLYENLRPTMRCGQLQASERFTFETFYSRLDDTKIMS